MKRTTLPILLALILGISMPMASVAGGVSDYEVVKGQLIDNDGDGIWEGISFFVKKKSTKVNIPVVNVDLIDPQTGELFSLNFNNIDPGKKMDEYYAELPGDGLSGYFSVQIEVDLSELYPDEGDEGHGGPGGKPTETVIIIDYP